MSDFDPRGYLNDVYAKAGPATSRAAAEALEAADEIEREREAENDDDDSNRSPKR